MTAKSIYFKKYQTLNIFIKKNILKVTNLFLLAILLFLISLDFKNNQNQIKKDITEEFIVTKTFALYSPPSYPIRTNQIEMPQISAQGVFVQDLNSGVVLYKKNENIRFAPASTTKIVTAIVSLDHYDLDEVLTVETIVDDGRTMGLVKGEKITVENLLYGALVHSANDAAYTLAENYPSGVDSFVQEMNETARELQLTNTHFTNPVGFDHDNQYTTAQELAIIAQAALKNKTFAKIVRTRAISVSDITSTYFHDLKNVNELLGKISGVFGVKTGYTQYGGEILITEINRNEKSVLFVVLKSLNRFTDTTLLVDWVFRNYTWYSWDKPIDTNH